MTYSINITNAVQCRLVQHHTEGIAPSKEVSLKTFFETAQTLGFFPEGTNFGPYQCDVTFDFYGDEKTILRSYQSMLEADCFGTEDLETIIKSFFDTFPEKIYWIKTNSILVLHRTPKCSNKDDTWRVYATTGGESRIVHQGFIDTEWSEYQTNQKLALEMLLKQLQGQVMVVKNQLENL